MRAGFHWVIAVLGWLPVQVSLAESRARVSVRHCLASLPQVADDRRIAVIVSEASGEYMAGRPIRSWIGARLQVKDCCSFQEHGASDLGTTKIPSAWLHV